jgi:MFS family permease
MGLAGLLWVPMSSFWGRAPVLFWTTFIGLLFCIGSAVTTTYSSFFATRALTGWFLTAAQTISIAFLKDMFFFHERARKIGLWALLYIASPYLGPCLSNFVFAGTGHWPDIFWLCSGVVALQLVFILVLIDETWYNREKHLDEQPVRASGFGGRLLRLVGVWQLQHHKTYFTSVAAAFKRFGSVIAKPAFLLIALS